MSSERPEHVTQELLRQRLDILLRVRRTWRGNVEYARGLDAEVYAICLAIEHATTDDERWIDFDEIGSPYHQQIEAGTRRHRHRLRNTDTWIDGPAPKAI